jgi:acetoacetyl-CoA reductase/3-oxoacyl-[acyl-carrier protein] reductase
VINVNLKGVNHTIKPFIEGMYRTTSGIESFVLVLFPVIAVMPTNFGYAATKAAVIGLVKSFAKLPVIILRPPMRLRQGLFDTEMTLAIPEKVRR